MSTNTITPAGGRRMAIAFAIASNAALTSPSEKLDFYVQGAITPSCGLTTTLIHIDLGTVSASELPSIGSTSPWHQASFKGIDCIGATRASVILRAPAYVPDPRYLAVSGSAAGVVIETQSESGQALPPDGSQPVVFTWVGDQAELAFRARYVRVGNLSPGPAGATGQIQITWE